jgi:HD-like signal output (HDOD) protein
MALPASHYSHDRPADEKAAGQGCAVAAATETPVKTRILFVDDEPAMLRVLKLGMRSMAGEWEVEFMPSGEEAVAAIEKRAFDVIVTDMRMPGMNGAQLLNLVLRLHPQTVRIVLSGYSELSEVVNCIGLTHQFLEKPCSLNDLKNCLKRITQVKQQLGNDRISNLAASLKNLPSLPEIYLEIADAIQSPNSTIERIADIASRDPAIAAKLLQLANSAFLGFNHKVYSLTEAVQLLGVSVIQSVAMAVPIFSAFARNQCPNFPIDQIWEHSLQTGILAQRISNHQIDDYYQSEQAFCAGLLHDVGKIILAESLPMEYGAVLQEAAAGRRPLLDVEQKYFRATHAEAGAYLLAIWGLPVPLVEAVAYHHYPRRCGTQKLSLAGVVHIANGLQHAGDAASPTASPMDLDYLKIAGLEQQFEKWRAEMKGS